MCRSLRESAQNLTRAASQNPPLDDAAILHFGFVLEAQNVVVAVDEQLEMAVEALDEISTLTTLKELDY